MKTARPSHLDGGLEHLDSGLDTTTALERVDSSLDTLTVASHLDGGLDTLTVASTPRRRPQHPDSSLNFNSGLDFTAASNADTS
jgi:hypothetical protein